MEKEIYNSYNCNNSVIDVNNNSTITQQMIGEMITTNFPLYYNHIKVIIESEDNVTLHNITKIFYNYAKEQFTVVTIQSAGLKNTQLSIFTKYGINEILKKLNKFIKMTERANYKIYY